MKQIEIDTEINSLDGRIAEVKREIEDRQDSYSEAPNRSEFFNMMHSDEIQRLERRIDSLQLKRDSLEMMIANDDPSVLSRMAAGAVTVLAFLIISAVAVLFGCCFLLENSELSWLS